MFSKLASFTFGLLVVTNGRAVPAAPAAPVSAAQDVRELLVAARGVAPSLCTLAADGVYSWGGRWTAPAEPVRSDIRSRVRRLHRRHLAADESRALLEGIASTDACERHLSATLIGRFGDSAIVRDLSTRLGAGAAPERQATLVALGLLEAKSQLQPIIHALRDEAPAVRANAPTRGCATQFGTRISSRLGSYATVYGLPMIVPGVFIGAPRMIRSGAVSPEAPSL